MAPKRLKYQARSHPTTTTGLKYTVTGFGSQFSHDGQECNRIFHLAYNFLVLLHLLVD